MTLPKQHFLNLKKQGYSERVRKGMKPKLNGLSADYLISGTSKGCELGCSYCYSARNNKEGNPVEKFTNVEEVVDTTVKFLNKLGQKKPCQTHPSKWVIDIGQLIYV